MKIHSALLALTLGATLSASANVTLPSIFSDHAVMQRSEKVPVWGKAEPNEKVTVTLDKATASATAGSDGKWKAELNLKPEGEGPYDLTVEGANKLVIKDVVIGEVWVCSGQSNMEFPLAKERGADAEIALPAKPLLRQFHASNVASPTPLDDNAGKWVTASPATIPTFTAIGYFFGKRLQGELKVPVGLISSSWGGTPIEPWISEEGNNSVPDLKKGKEKAVANYESGQNFLTQYQAWAEKNHRNDHPLPASLDPYISSNASTTDWQTVKLPAKFSDIGLPDAGAVWLRKKITIPQDLVKELSLYSEIRLGELHESMIGYWNTKKIGQSHALGDVPLWPWIKEAGEVTLAVRVSSASSGMGLLAGKPVPGHLSFSVGDKIPLDGEWQAKVEYALPPLTSEEKASMPVANSLVVPKQSIPDYLYNGMIHPFVPYAIAGVLWYQGETNVGRALQYQTAFPLLITDWRRQWGQGDFPFYFCQLANFGARYPVPEKTGWGWAELREAQTRTLAVPNTGQAVLIDLGEEGDIHPRDKNDVGERLLLNALAKTYGKQVLYSGPVYDSMVVEGDKIRVKFKNTDGGLVAKSLPATYTPKSLQPNVTIPLVRNSPESEVEGFAICGDDKKFVWADAKIDGNDIIVSAPSVTHPVAIRYAWADNPLCNLYNGAGLPAGPFRSNAP